MSCLRVPLSSPTRAAWSASLGLSLAVLGAVALLAAPSARAGEPLFGAPVSFPTGPGPFTAAYGDLNADGFPDIVSGNWTGGSISVLLSTGNISFYPPDNYSTPYSVSFVATGDLNEDGFPDIVAPVYDQGFVMFFFNNGDGTFRRGSDITTGGNPSCVAIVDLNADGHLDLAVTRDQDAIAPNLRLYSGDGQGGVTFMTSLTTSCGSNRIVVDDFNRDGKTDLAVSSFYSCGPGLSVHLQSSISPWVFSTTIRSFGLSGGCYGIVTADFNGDSYPDLATTSDAEGKARVLLNLGDGTFGAPILYGTDRAGNDGTLSLVAADFDQDGDMDIVLANRGYDNVTPLLGNGDGTFVAGADYYIGDGPAYLLTADFDLDARPDLLTPIESSASMAMLFGNGDGSFANEPLPRVGVRPRDLAIADFNRDGFADIVTVGDRTGSGPGVTLLTNLGNGQSYSRSDILAATSYSEVEAADLTGDGWPDLATTAGGRIWVYVNAHPGWFFTQQVDFGATGLALGDVNGDLRPDIVATRFDFVASKYVATVHLANGPGTFQTPGSDYDVGKGALFVRLADTNRDGKLDIVVANNRDGNVSVLQGKGDGTFKSKSNYGTGKNPLSLAAGDLNGDGRADLAVGNLGDGTVAVLNSAGASGYRSRVKYDTDFANRSVQMADFNGDGRLDVSAVSFGRDAVTVLLGNGDGTLGVRASFAVGNNPLRSDVGDLNNDGHPDLVTCHFSNQNMSILLNSGSGTLVPAASFAPLTELSSARSPEGVQARVARVEVSPNPLNPEATLSFTITRPGPVRIGLYDVQGRLVRTLLDRPSVEAGRIQVRIDGKDERGHTLGTGVYYFRLEAAKEVKTGRITVLK